MIYIIIKYGNYMQGPRGLRKYLKEAIKPVLFNYKNNLISEQEKILIKFSVKKAQY